MRVLHGLEAVDLPLTQSVLSVGNFDGVHRAHQQLLAQAGLFAANTGGPVVVLTFEPHPLSIVAPAKAPPRLSPLEEKLRHLAEAGADITVVAKSEPKLLDMEADRFVEEVIIRRFHPTHIVEGPSFGFGRGRTGTPDVLRRTAARFDCEVHILGPVTVRINGGEMLMVSSSMIRRLLADGKVRRAALCLGRPYPLLGRVVPGAGRGRTIGFPTANVEVSDQLVPGDGVYAGGAVIEGKRYAAAVSIGRQPTFGGTRQVVEAFLLDFEGDVYGRAIRIELHRRLRRQQAFGSPDALVEQMRRDIETLRRGIDPSRPDAPGGEVQAE